MNESYKHSEITELILKAFFKVYNTLGEGFLEKVYENAMMIELASLGLHCYQQYRIAVYYASQQVGDYFADIMVNNCVILELKAATCLMPEHESQLLNYLRATDIEVGILLNFGKTPQYKRCVFSERYKKQRNKE